MDEYRKKRIEEAARLSERDSETLRQAREFNRSCKKEKNGEIK